jgi:hypothetical protein
MSRVINVNTDALVKMTARLESVNKNAMPNAVRGTLNALAFDVKKRTLPESASETFVNRNKSFFKAFTRVNMASGNKLESMQSEVGFYDRGAKGKQAIPDLEKQEQGGTIAGRSFIPLETARTGKSRNRMVTAKNRLGRIANAVHAENAKGRTDKEKFMKSVIFAGVGGIVIGNYAPNVVYRITSIENIKGKLKVKKTPLYTYDKGRSVRVTGTRFSEQAAMETVRTTPSIWVKEGQRILERFKK